MRGVSGPLKAAWALTIFVILGGVVLWVITGRAAFAIFVGLGLVTALGAWVTGRHEARARAASEKRTTSENDRELP